MEAPVAAALGKLDAFNLFDPWWTDVEYDIYYRMLAKRLSGPLERDMVFYPHEELLM